MSKKEHKNASIKCVTCNLWFHPLGIMSHRRMHKNRKEVCEITYTNGNTKIHDFRRA